MHLKVADTVGDAAPHECWTLGGPYSCRGFQVGELGVAKRLIEYGAELRAPVPFARTYAYAFHEGVNGKIAGGLELSGGNPTAYYRKAGAGSGTGFGMKVGAARVEWCRDNISGRGTWFVRFGERY